MTRISEYIEQCAAEFDEGKKEQWNSGDPYWPDWDGVKSHHLAKLKEAYELGRINNVKKGT